jgi:hypothetical protein
MQLTLLPSGALSMGWDMGLQHITHYQSHSNSKSVVAVVVGRLKLLLPLVIIALACIIACR